MVSGLREMSNTPNLRKFALRLRIFSNRRRHEVLAEDVFRRIFCWERKRAERSGRCFLLMLVRVESILQANQSEKALSEIVSALTSSTRETDLAGWYQEGAILGVIFTEIREGNWEALESLTSAKVMASLRSKLSPEQLDQMRISFHFFPEKGDNSSLGGLANTELYPDLLERDEERKFSRFVKRSMDIAGSLAALIICCPLFVLISLAIKLTSKGPILFKQERVGQYGSRFIFSKFRSMECGSDARIHRAASDPLRVGRLPDLASSSRAGVQAGNHRAVASEGPEQGQVRRHGTHGSALCENVVALAGCQDSFANAGGCAFRCRRLLKGFGGAIGFSPFTPRVDNQNSFPNAEADGNT